ncbi:MAG: YfhO family protein, partial [Ruminococcus sp.]|nr:YfhO family protein [Ruminococcus sp.]
MSSKTNNKAAAVSAVQPDKKRGKLYTLICENGVLHFLLAFFIPSAIMLYAFMKNDMHPYGSNQMLVVDLCHQYYPFFRVFCEKLMTGGSFMYSWQNGMGTNFLSLISYYASSPLYWVSVFFDDEHVRDSLMYILIAKIGFGSAFFNCFLRYTFKRRDLSTVLFGALFALCSYTLGYYWNVMWFDTIALFPLVMTGITALCREGKWKLYTIALALSLISNYYIGYFTCIFTMFMFAASIIIEGKGIKDFFYKVWLILRSSILGIGLGAFILIPAYMGLRLTYSMNNVFPAKVSWYEEWTDIFANLLSYSEPAMKDGLPNFACGMLAVVLIGPFLFSLGIKIREKIAAVLMLAFIAVSCNMNILNYIWHGFHVTNQIPYRFAFIFCFVLLTAAYRAYD